MLFTSAKNCVRHLFKVILHLEKQCVYHGGRVRACIGSVLLGLLGFLDLLGLGLLFLRHPLMFSFFLLFVSFGFCCFVFVLFLTTLKKNNF